MTGKDIKTKAIELVFTIVVAVTGTIVTVAFKVPEMLSKKAPYDYVDKKYEEAINYTDKQLDRSNQNIDKKLDLIIQMISEKQNKLEK